MKILVPVEDVLFASAIVNFIAQHQWPAAAEFQVITVIEPFLLEEFPPVAFGQLMESSSEYLLGEAHHVVEEVAQSIKSALPGVSVSAAVLTGHVKEQILTTAEQWGADMIVAGSHGRSGFNRLVLGSVSLMLLCEAPCPVMLVRPDAKTAKIWEKVNPNALPKETIVDILADIYVEREPRKIIVALDEAELSEQIIDMVGKHEWIPPAIFKLLSVVRKPVWLGRLTKPGFNEAYLEMIAKRAGIIGKLASKLSLALNNPNVEEEVKEGDAKQIIIDTAVNWDADLIVVGSHAPFAGPKLGSVALAVLCAAPCPVLLLRQPGPQASPLSHSDLSVSTRV